MPDKTAAISALIDKAAQTQDSGEALRFAQAAAEAAQALVSLKAALAA